MLANGALGARQLASNETLTRFGVSDGEQLWMSYKMLQALTGAPKADVAAFLQKATAVRSTLAQVLHCTESLAYMKSLDKLGNHFRFQPVFTIAWIRRHLHQTAGGVSTQSIWRMQWDLIKLQILTELTNYMANVTLSLVTPTDFFEMSDNSLYANYKELESGKDPIRGLDSEAVSLAAVRTWKSLADPVGEHTRTAVIGMLTDALMTALDEQAVAHFRRVGYSIATDSKEWNDAFREYMGSVYDLFKEHVLLKSFSTTGQRMVQKSIARKLEWIFHTHRSHYQRPLPLLTKSILPLLAAGFEDVDEALREVSFGISPVDTYRVTNRT
jgi:hypothetical protein